MVIEEPANHELSQLLNLLIYCRFSTVEHLLFLCVGCLHTDRVSLIARTVKGDVTIHGKSVI